MMECAKVFTNGGSQAVRLPRSCRFEEPEVMVRHIGDVVMLMPKKDPWSSIRSSLELFTDDFLTDDIEDLPVQERACL